MIKNDFVLKMTKIVFISFSSCVPCDLVTHMGLEFLLVKQINIQSEHLSHVCSH